MFSIAGILEVLAILVVAFFVWGLNPVARWKYRHIPGPTPGLFFGNLLQMNGMHNALLRWANDFGPVFKFFMGRFTIVVINDADLVKAVGVQNFMRFHDRFFGRMFLSTKSESDISNNYGILMATGKYWTGVRAACEPMFHAKSLSSFAPMMNQAAAKLAGKCLDPAAVREPDDDDDEPNVKPEAAAAPPAEGSSFNIGRMLAPFTLEVIGTTAFGVDLVSHGEGSTRLFKEANFVMSPPKNPANPLRMLALIAPSLTIVWFTLANWLGSSRLAKIFRSRGYLLGTSQVLLENAQRGSAPPEGSDSTSEVPRVPGLPPNTALVPIPGDKIVGIYTQGKREARADHGRSVPTETSILNVLSKATDKTTGAALTNAQIIAQAQTFILAGYETTSVTLTYAIFALASYPEVERKLLAEVDAFWHSGTKSMGYEDLDKVPYAAAIIYEAMRLWPPVTPTVGLQRLVNETTTVGGWKLPRGTWLFFNVLAMHKNPKYFPEPEEFRPERFLEGSPEAKARHPYAYIPFGVGPRKCVGYKFAMEEAVIALVQLFRALTFKLDPERHPVPGELEFRSGITLAPKDGVWVTAHPR